MDAKTGTELTSIPWVGLSIPFVLALIIFFVSPNFQVQDGVRDQPFAGDFVQEWVGGYLVEHEPERLYDLEYVRSVQHDSELVGFEWPEEKYFPMVYPPFYYAAMWPISKLELKVASGIWLFSSAAIFAFSAILFWKQVPESRALVAWGLCACIIFTPLIKCLTMSHKSAWLLMILTTTFLLLKSGRVFLSGLVFGLIAFKPHLGILIGLTMLAKRQWSFVAGSILVVTMMVGASWCWGSGWWSGYFETVSQMANYVESGGYQLAESHSLWGATQLSLGGLGSTWAKVATLIGTLGIVALLAWLVREDFVFDSMRFRIQYAALVIAMAVTSPHFYTYDMTVLLLPMVLLGSSLGPNWLNQKYDRLLGISLILLFCLAGSFATFAASVPIQLSLVLTIGILILSALIVHRDRTTVVDDGEPRLDV